MALIGGVLYDTGHVLIVNTRLLGDALLLERAPGAVFIHHERAVKEGVVKVVDASAGNEQSLIVYEVHVLAMIAYRAIGDDARHGACRALTLFVVLVSIEPAGAVAAPVGVPVGREVGDGAVQGE